MLHLSVIKLEMRHSKKLLIHEINKFLFVATGAIPGALLRWHINNNVLVNYIGALIFGFVIGYRCRESLKLLIGIGFCGTLTTFSNWMIDCLDLILNGSILKAASLIFIPLDIGILVSAIGHSVGAHLKSFRFS